ncbi:MAG: corrinoid protein [Thermodesulfobacteriota bacterium]|jgi:5-methyltetrahydrofolate--homocysteine methyltransferase
MGVNLIYEAVVNGDRTAVDTEVKKTITDGVAPEVILNEGLIKAMGEVGRRFESGDFFVPEMLIAARAMKAGVAILRPHLINAGVKPVGKVVIGTVAGDLHDIGKNLVGLMLEGAGFEVIDLGTDVSNERFVEAVRKERPDLVGISALLTTTMSGMAEVVKILKESNLKEDLKVFIGGAPVTQTFAEQIGADGYADDAASASRKARELLNL